MVLDRPLSSRLVFQNQDQFSPDSGREHLNTIGNKGLVEASVCSASTNWTRDGTAGLWLCDDQSTMAMSVFEK